MTFPLKSKVLLILLTFLSVSCARTEDDIKKNDDKVIVNEDKTISIMAYNVENLFDTLQDADREDYTYLPLAYKQTHPDVIANCNLMAEGFYKQECLNLDWSQAVLDLKLKRVSETILGVGKNGPDIVIIEEIENLNALQLLAKAMPEANYQTVVLLEGEDKRGIDVGILSRLPLLETRMNLLDFTAPLNNPNWKRPNTRGIMEAALKLPNGDKLTVLGFHFPSQSNPVQNRIDAVNTLNKVMDRLGSDSLVIAGGDSNITPAEDDQHGLRTTMMESRWKVSHKMDCKKTKDNKPCEGTYYYKKQWQHLDILAFSNALTNGKGSYQLKKDSIRIPNHGKLQLLSDGSPARFDELKDIGVTDHLPVYGEIELK